MGAIAPVIPAMWEDELEKNIALDLSRQTNSQDPISIEKSRV
jgi:hypothetical protein